MNNTILVVNCGSSSIKYALIDNDRHAPRIEGIAEGLGGPDAVIHHKDRLGNKTSIPLPGGKHDDAMASVLPLLGDTPPKAIGHRIVHGGEDFTGATLLTDEVLQAVNANAALAPLHNPANLVGVAATQALFPDLPQVGVFDTAFHQTMPEHAYRYALPTSLYSEHGIRRYGFHGTSHAYLSHRADTLCRTDGLANGWLVAHLGNGCSTCAVYNGKSLDTSMGLTPLEGVPMGTRSGDIDPGIIMHLHRALGMSIDEIDQLLNKQSGLKGVSGLSNDMRTLSQAADEGHDGAKLAIALFTYKVAKSLAAKSCALPVFSGIIFSGGIGENGTAIREGILSHLMHFGIRINKDKNAQLTRGEEGTFHADDSAIQLWVIPTDEEGRIAEETRQLLTE